MRTFTSTTTATGCRRDAGCVCISSDTTTFVRTKRWTTRRPETGITGRMSSTDSPRRGRRCRHVGLEAEPFGLNHHVGGHPARSTRFPNPELEIRPPLAVEVGTQETGGGGGQGVGPVALSFQMN